MTFINASSSDLREANMMVPDLYRPTTEGDMYFVIRNGDGWTTALHESYDDDTIAEHVEKRSTFATKELAEQHAWFWIVESVDDETEYYSDAAKTLLGALQEVGWQAYGRQFDTETQDWSYDGQLDQYDQELHRMVIALQRKGITRKFLTVEEAGRFVTGEFFGDEANKHLEKTETVLNDGAILTEYAAI